MTRKGDFRPVTKTTLRSVAKAIRILGGVRKTARAMKVTEPSVANWLVRGVAAQKAPILEELTRKSGNPVFCEALAPDVKWSVVRRNPLPPKSPRKQKEEAVSTS
jgi:DNA-binding transcriptional regulator YdaS (Cro superfamily)